MATGPTIEKVRRVDVLAEWALKSKESTDAGYRLLNTSQEVLSADNFEAMLQRYSPGTLETLPQVTISWLEDKSGHSGHLSGAPASRGYVGIAIHDQPSSPVADAGGRRVVTVSCYCVDFRSLRERNISYRSMYEGFKDFDLYGRAHGYIETSLRVADPVPPECSLTYQAAGLLLTNKSVCILGADDTAIDVRLRFIDEVASLLPYGMRSRLSAATWTSSTYKRHNFRLFFSSVERDADDYHLVWGDTLAATGLATVDAYIDWLMQSPARRVMRLAEEGQETGFGTDHTKAMLTRLGLQREPPRSAPATARRQPLIPGSSAQVTPETAEDLFNAITRRLAGSHPEQAERFVPRLRSLIRDDLADSDRARYRQIIDEHQLLREDLKIDREVRAELYRTLLRLAYRVPLNYTSYCAIEGSLGNGWPIHESLARAIYEVSASEAVQLLVVGIIGEAELNDFLHKRELRLKRLVAVIVHPRVQEDHRRFLCEIALQYLEEQPQRFSPDELRAAFAPVGYLAAILFQVYRDDPQVEFSMVRRVLQIVYGHRLDRESISAILSGGDSGHTCALYAVLFELADDYSADEIIWSGFGAYLMSREFGTDAQAQLNHKLAAYRPADPDSEDSGKSRLKFKFKGSGR